VRKRGLVLVNTGDGKGKTTAAFGMVLRAAAHGMRVLVVQFVKGGRNSPEIRTLRKLEGVSVTTAGLGFLNAPRISRARHVDAAGKAFEAAETAILSGKFDMVVLDEALLAVREKLIEESDILNLIARRPGKTHLVLTGRGCSRAIIGKADIATEMRSLKHVFDKGMPAQKGVEF
jgi:cob(I)alamin adenosyltransferase